MLNWIKNKWNKENAKDKCGAGFFATSIESKFTPACAKHDQYYLAQKEGKLDKTRLEVDRELLYDLLVIANKYSGAVKLYLKSRAYLYYALTRTFGGIIW